MTTVLMIDDDADVLATIGDHLKEADPDIRFVEETDFEKGLACLQALRPDVLILDWFHGDPTTGHAAGQDVLSTVWEEWFCPIVIYSAGAVDEPPEHPFIRVVAKGGATEQAVGEHIQGYMPHVSSLREVSQDLSRMTSQVLRHLAPIVFEASADEHQRSELFTRAARRRIAAAIDDATVVGDVLPHAWEQYIFPVLTEHLVTGDLLKNKGAQDNDPAGYRVVITPTCDMVPHGQGGACKVTDVLAVRCCDAAEFAEKGLSLARGTKVNKVKDKLRSALNEAQQSGFVLLPECPLTIPMMAVNLRDLELIPLTHINAPGDDEEGYLRIASLDSPFREYFIWAYMQVACRPGLPPRNMDTVTELFGTLWAPPTTGGAT